MTSNHNLQTTSKLNNESNSLKISKLIPASATQPTLEQPSTPSSVQKPSAKETTSVHSETADSRIANLFKLPHRDLIRKYEQLWMAFRINPYPDGKFLHRLVQITEIPADEIKLWCLAKRVLLNVSWNDEQIATNRERPSLCDCPACNILLEDKRWDAGCYASDLEMTDQFLLYYPEDYSSCSLCHN